MAKSTETEEAVPATSAPDRLGAMLNECLRGKSYTITRYGRAVARLVPIDPDSKGQK